MKIAEKYTDYAFEQIAELCRIPSPSGYTHLIQNYLITLVKEFKITPIVTNKGSVIVEYEQGESPLALLAHVDTLGAMVRSIKGNGRLRLTTIGGYPLNNIEGENCYIHTRDGKMYSGTIQLTHSSAHVFRDINEIKRSDETIEVVIDEKVETADDVKKIGIRPGDFITVDPRTVMTDSGYIKSRHLDDKAAAGIFLALIKMIADKKLKLNRKLYFIFTTYEEVGHGASSCVPDDVVEGISVDMGAVGDDLQTDEHKVSICAKDSVGPYDYDITTRLVNLAEELKLNYAVDIYPYYGSDVENSLIAGYDMKHGLLGPGVSASHGYERTHREGIENTLRLLAAYITK